MEVQFLSSPKDFLSIAADQLASNEARYGLIQGISSRLIDSPYAFGKTNPWFCVVSEGNVVHAVALRTPPYNVVIAHFSEDPAAIASILVESITNHNNVIPGVSGDKAITDQFAQLWSADHKTKIIGIMAERIYVLRKVRPFKCSPGKLRVASDKDIDLVKNWAHSFHQEVFSPTSPDMPESDPVPSIKSGKFYVWENRTPVSIAASVRPTKHGIAIAYVYTPPELRRQGYATSCVASLCQKLLDTGYEFCTLFADLANPTSNAIYKSIGFEELCDSVLYSFAIPK